MEAANNWLQSSPTVSPISLSIETESSFGLFANHSEAAKITIGFKDLQMSTGYKYGMCEEERTSIFIKGNKEAYKKEWAENNPDLELVMLSASTNARGDMASLAMGFGQRVEYTKLFIVYRRPLVQ